jgi:hypothetical protein
MLFCRQKAHNVVYCRTMKNGFIIFVWFVGCIGSVIAGVVTFYLNERQSYSLLTVSNSAEERLALPNESLADIGQVQGIQTAFEAEDARPQLVANFLKRHNSPMEPHDEHGKMIVEISDRYGIDFRLLPAIAMQESGLCKAIPKDSYNCLGFGIHSRGTLKFESYEAAFDRAARELKKNYIDQGRTTPEQIMKKYTPSSNGSWAVSVNQWMAEMRYDDRELGRELRQPGANVLEFAGTTDQASPAASPVLAQ